ncbi:universal stress protein [Actibacterium sp. 188UL27-1]|uniref:universal stress protein n=1 Tax=Actibacterium sp. 188UL27-1 TaxID=2786961 RepID=UPI00195E20F2|nr:universal stress protein [Actibacterium sp. 188UL27-1]MBM7066823.1 universal stress protein [Actibacterium sp. 188UL27-1]
MKRFKNILVVCEEASNIQPALQRALLLAQANGAQVTLMDVLDAAPGDFARIFAALPGARAAEVENKVLEYHQNRLEQLAEPFRAAGIPVQKTLQQGTAFLKIIQQVLREDHDLLIKGVHARGSGAAILFRGFDLHLLRKCPCPVWIIKDESGATSSHIMAAVDPDPEDETRNALGQTVMQLSTTLAEIDDANLHVVNAWRLQEESTLRHGRIAMPPDELDKILDRECRNSEWRLNTLLKEFPDATGRRVVHHLKGMAGEIIPNYAEENGIDTIVTGTVGRTGISGFFIGNTAETILSRVDCSVIALKPPGFISPVTLENETAA